ncbi:MAG: potassium channel protein [Lysobacterales bacterium]|nr:MAG: potassium channel protein [Xanthomonadales bacterium]
MTRPFAKTHFFWLTLALILMLIASAVARELPYGWALRLVWVSSTALLLLSLLSLGGERKRVKGFVAIIGLMVCSGALRTATGSVTFEYAYLALFTAFLALAAWMVAQRVLLTGTIDLNTIVGSVALYLLIGLIYSTFFTVLLELSPDAFRGIEPGPLFKVSQQMTYFSFVTLATLGYGDISPASPIAQVIVILEAVTGTFYMAIVVASLIGAYFGRQPR